MIAGESTNAKEGLVKIDRQLTELDDPDQNPVPADKQIRAFNYGKQLVPVAKEHEHVLKYKGGATEEKKDDDGGLGVELASDYERQFKLLGFTEQSKVPRHHFMAGVDVILPVRGSKNERAFAALVAAMVEGKKVLIAKIIERKNADLSWSYSTHTLANANPFYTWCNCPLPKTLGTTNFHH